MIKKVNYKIQGMQRDLSESAFNPQFAYENFNIRINPKDDKSELLNKGNTLLSITNEKGNKAVTSYPFVGDVIGCSIMNENLIIFSTEGNDNPSNNSNKDKIYKVKINFDSNSNITSNIKLLFSGNLNFSKEHPIETIPYYENENIQKIYWLDGINQPRVIDIERNYKYMDNYSFDFLQIIEGKEKITVTKNTNLSGTFPSGTVQYAFSYFNRYGQQSNLVDMSSLSFISPDGRGARPDEIVNNVFEIKIDNLDKRFDYVRVYSITKTTLEGQPIVKIIEDVLVENKNSISVIDNGINGSIIDGRLLLFLNKDELIANTFTHKDNTLFMGDIEYKQDFIGNIEYKGVKIKDYVKSLNVEYTEDKEDSIRIFFDDVSIIEAINKGSNINDDETYLREITSNELYPYTSELRETSKNTRILKSSETYRLGIQFQNKNAKWSEALWVTDFFTDVNYDNIPEEINYNIKLISRRAGVDVKYPVIKFDNDFISFIRNNGYVKVRPIIVYPKEEEKEVLAQGVLCPTVYSVKDRANDITWAQSSWAWRPTLIKKYANERNGVYNSPHFIQNVNGKSLGISKDDGTKGNELEHEIYCNNKQLAEPHFPSYSSSSSGKPLNDFLKEYEDLFFVDTNTVTFHSPDLEFNKNISNLENSNYKLRIIGVAIQNLSNPDITVSTSTPQRSSKGRGLNSYWKSWYDYSKITGALNSSYDDETGSNDKDRSNVAQICLWQPNRGLNTWAKKDGIYYSQLDKKRISHLKFCSQTLYTSRRNRWNAKKSGEEISHERDYFDFNGITKLGIYDVNNPNKIIKLNFDKNANITKSLTYKGSIDTIINNKNGYKDTKYSKYNNEDTIMYDPTRMQYNSTTHAIFSFNPAYSYKNDYYVSMTLPYIKTNSGILEERTSFNFRHYPFWIKDDWMYDGSSVLKEDQPLLKYIQSEIKLPHFYYDMDEKHPYQEHYYNYWGSPLGYLIGELYKDNNDLSNSIRFGGTSNEAIINNDWNIAGDSVNLFDYTTNQLKITYKEGDTYYQRYDCLKTYGDMEYQNSLVDILSFCCETRYNLEGRYDRNRGNKSNIVASPLNFNLFNDVYNQKNNFFNYKGVDYNRLSVTKFPNNIIWSNTKNNGELIDTWTNISTINMLDMDGDKGRVRALRKFNNDIISFQDSGIANILFNSRVQMATSDAIPIEIANSGKVDGKRYILNNVGTTNKWSIVETSHGLFFIDTLAKSIKLLGSDIQDLSSEKGFTSWINKESTINVWNPKDFNNITTFYDKKNDDVYFVNKNYCLCYSNILKQFTSFYSYENTPFMVNVKDKFLSIRNNKNTFNIWEQNGGDYNSYFGEIKPFYSTVIVNDNPTLDKTFTNIEFRADTVDENNILITDRTFDTLEAWNEYQYGVSNLHFKRTAISNLKRKFRIWYADIPRDKKHPLQRLRNPWLYVKLGSNNPSTNKTVLHDLMVNYII